MKKSLFIILFITVTSVFQVKTVQATSPIGNLDQASNGVISGWAKDDDYTGAIPVHIYIDDKLYEDTLANVPRGDVGNHAIYYKYAPLGNGNHKVEVYAIGVNNTGSPDGQNMMLSGSPKYINDGCNGLVADENEWCRNNGDYWVNRQRDTKYLWNKYIRIGINNSYGGLISQLYSEDRGFNLIEEHGGSAVQISLYGYDLTKGNTGAWFVSDGSICSKYNSENECKNANAGKSCVERGAANGDHAANCSSIKPCNGVDAGWPFNPIQAQGINCSWESPSNDVSYSGDCGTNCWETKLDNPANFSKSTSFNGMTINQKVSLEDVFAKVDYRITYSGPYTLSEHPQEIPAFFTNVGIDKKFQFYNGNSPWSLNSQVRDISVGVGDRVLAFPNFKQSSQPYDSSKEYWMGVCSQDNSKCITIATFSNEVENTKLNVMADGGAYITPLGYFNIYPGMNRNITLYIFPYKYDKVINGKSVRQRIFELAVANGIPTNTSPTPTRAPTPTPTPTPKPGDLNGDNKVDISDYKLLVADFGKTNSPADINGNDTVDIFDYNILVANFGLIK